MDFSWSKEQEELKGAAVKFAQGELNHAVGEREKKAEFSYDGWHACAAFGLQGALIPKEYGGMGLDPLDVAAVLEGVGYGCRDNGLVFSVNAHMWACEIPLLRYGSETQKKTYLSGMSRGKLIGANAMTEPDSGSDVYALKTQAVEDGDHYILNGTKTFVTNAPVADVFVVYARVGETKGFAGICCFLVEKGTENMMIGKPFEKMGLKTSPMAEVAFDDCRIPKKNLIGKPGSGWIIFADSMEWERIFILASAIGVMEYQVEACLKYARERKVAGKPIGKNQAVADKLTGMRLRLETSRMMLYKAAWMKSENKKALMESALSKLQVSESYVQNCRDAMQIFGGYGYMVEYEMEREMRDALAATLYSGTTEIQRNIVAALSGF
jgi:alkylation response protein AidB-like acyl-CoA dehydrogenase